MTRNAFFELLRKVSKIGTAASSPFSFCFLNAGVSSTPLRIHRAKPIKIALNRKGILQPQAKNCALVLSN